MAEDFTAIPTSIDRVTLPQSMLTLMREHARIEYERDNAYLINCLTRAIDLFERLTEVAVFRQTWTVDALLPPDSGIGWLAPAFPVSTIVATENALPVENAWYVSPPSFSGAWFPQYLYRRDSPVFDSGPVSLTLTIGYATAAEIAPGIVDVVLRASAWLYENREAQNMTGLDAANYMNSMMTAYWKPRL